MNLYEYIKLEASFMKELNIEGEPKTEVIRNSLNLAIHYLKRAKHITDILYRHADFYSESSLNDKSGPLNDDELAALFELYRVTELIGVALSKTCGVKTEFPEPRDPDEGIPF